MSSMWWRCFPMGLRLLHQPPPRVGGLRFDAKLLSPSRISGVVTQGGLTRHRIGAAAAAVSRPYQRGGEQLYSANRVKTYFGEDAAVAKLRFEYELTEAVLRLRFNGHVSVDGATDYRLRAVYRRPLGSNPFTYAVRGSHRDGTVYITATERVAFEPAGDTVDHNPGHKRLADVITPVQRRLAELELLHDHRGAYAHLSEIDAFDGVSSFLADREEIFACSGDDAQS
ncbi:hypothetical protein JT689_04595 [Halobacterium sp. GSL-19]|nr:hypothetical protein [Halobacterium salinarum]MCF2168810.1 hypothetical protein [Halobacterium salinarum]QRY23311.1 hypothetical protein JT689_04595 [Halobacterium sp. GSL-19]